MPTPTTPWAVNCTRSSSRRAARTATRRSGLRDLRRLLWRGRLRAYLRRDDRGHRFRLEPISGPFPCAPPPPPSINSVYPADGASGVALNSPAYAIFNRAMDKPTAEGAFTLKLNSSRPAGERRLQLGPERAHLQARHQTSSPGPSTRPPSPPPPRTSPGTRFAAAKSWQFTTTNPPSINSVYPADGASGVALNSPAYAIFNRAMDKPTAEGAFTLKRTSDGAPVSGVFSLVRERAHLQARLRPASPGPSTRPPSPPPPRTSPATRSRPRRAGSSRRRNPPSINSVYPADGASGVALNSPAYAIFNRAMDKPTAEGAFTLKRTSDGAPVSGAFRLVRERADLQARLRPPARDPVHGHRLHRRQGPCKATHSPIRSPGAIRREPPARAPSG